MRKSYDGWAPEPAGKPNDREVTTIACIDCGRWVLLEVGKSHCECGTLHITEVEDSHTVTIGVYRRQT